MTLVEVLVALTLLSVTLIVFITVIRGANQAGQKGSYLAIATRTAGNQIALAQATNTSLLTSGTTTYTVAGLPKGSMTVKIGPLAGNAANTYIDQIDVTVTWSNASTTAKVGGIVTMSTLVSAKK
jgi:type II secretory pathway pseudopilin PulG